MKTNNETDQLAEATIQPANHCDTCTREHSDCKKLILAGGQHICAV